MCCSEITPVLIPPLHSRCRISCDRTKGTVADTAQPALNVTLLTEEPADGRVSPCFQTVGKNGVQLQALGCIVLLASAVGVHSASSKIKNSVEFKLTELPFCCHGLLYYSITGWWGGEKKGCLRRLCRCWQHQRQRSLTSWLVKQPETPFKHRVAEVAGRGACRHVSSFLHKFNLDICLDMGHD